MLFRFLDKLRRKRSHQRRAIAFFGSTGVVLVLLFVWFSSGSFFSAGERVGQEIKAHSPFASLRDSFSKVSDNFSSEFEKVRGNIESSFEGFLEEVDDLEETRVEDLKEAEDIHFIREGENETASTDLNIETDTGNTEGEEEDNPKQESEEINLD